MRMKNLISLTVAASIALAPTSLVMEKVVFAEPVNVAENNQEEMSVNMSIVVFNEEGSYSIKDKPMVKTIDKNEHDEGFTVLGALQATSEYEGDGFITSIDGIEAPSTGGWMFTVNDVSPEVGAREVELKEGDKVLWYMTYDWQRDMAPNWEDLVEKPSEEEDIVFEDLSNHSWAKNAINSMASKGIISGKSKDKFDPASNITRAEFSSLVSRALKLDEESIKDSKFEDVKLDSWYAKSVMAMYENGLVSGKSDKTFDPEGNITREEISRIIGQVLQSKSYDKQDINILDQFNDKDKISDWALEDLAIVVHNKLIIGNEGKIMAKENASRAEAAVVLYNLYELITE